MFLQRFFLVSFLIVVLLGFTTTVHAQDKPLDLTVSPVYFDFSLSRGQTKKEVIKLRNNTLQPIPLEVSIKKIVPDSTGDITLTDLPADDQTASWFHFQSATISAKPQEVVDVPFTLTIPNDAGIGYYVAITFTLHAPKTSQSEAVTASVSIPVLINVKTPGATIEARIVNFKTSSFINEYLPISFITSIANVGNVHIRPTGNIFIRNNSDKDLAVLDVNKQGGIIIPGETRTFSSEWKDGFITMDPVMEDGQVKRDRNNQPIRQLAIHWDKLTTMRFGEYTASLLIVYDNGTKDVALEANTQFWVIPYTFIIVSVVIILIIIISIRFLLKWYVKQALKKYKVA